MKKEKLKMLLNNFCSFGHWLLKQVIVMALVGIMAILYYEAGRAEMFSYPTNADEFCEQHEKDLNALNEIEYKNKNEGAKNYEN